MSLGIEGKVASEPGSAPLGRELLTVVDRCSHVLRRYSSLVHALKRMLNNVYRSHPSIHQGVDRQNSHLMWSLQCIGIVKSSLLDWCGLNMPNTF